MTNNYFQFAKALLAGLFLNLCFTVIAQQNQAVLANFASSSVLSASIPPPANFVPEDFAVADMNRDGLPDVISVNNDNTLDIWTGTGAGQFQLYQTINLTNSSDFPIKVIAADLNGDGYPDLVIEQFFTPILQVYTNNGDGTVAFCSEATFYNTNNGNPFYNLPPVAIDVNDDGINDLIMGNNVFTNNGHAVFTHSSTLTAFNNNMVSIAVADVTGDGRMDLIMGQSTIIPLGGGSYQTGGSLTIFVNLGNGSFSERAGPITGIGPYPVAADINGDGMMDLIVANRGYQASSLELNFPDNSMQIFINQGGSFVLSQTLQVMSNSRSQFIQAIPADYNADGAIDILCSGSSYGVPDANTYLYLNDGTGHFVQTNRQASEWTLGSKVVASDLGNTGVPGLICNQTVGGNNEIVAFESSFTPLQVLNSFGQLNPPADGLHPEGGLVAGAAGYLYGVCRDGGQYGYGTISRIKGNQMTTLVPFNDSNGANPVCRLVLAPDGNFYGTTQRGGTNYSGTVFKVTAGGVLTVLHSFNGTDGSTPNSLTLGQNGLLYGTCQYGGSSYQGTFFVMDTSGNFTNLYSFTGTDEGGQPLSVIQGQNGDFYGTAASGGTNFNGTLFEISPVGGIKQAYKFGSVSSNGVALDGSSPNDGLTFGGDGNLYGTTSSGGTYNEGTIFRFNTNGILTNLHSFYDQVNNDGQNPGGMLILGSDGSLYGTTTLGGTNQLPFTSGGTIFKMSTGGSFATVWEFNGVTAGNATGLLLGTNGVFYGTSHNGGAYDYINGGGGAVFQFATNGGLNVLYTFGENNPTGACPIGGLILGAKNILYGTTYAGGTNGDYGSVFGISTNGLITLVTSLAGTNDSHPFSTLAQDPTGKLYGTTAFGGAGKSGSVFTMSTSGVYSNLFTFNATNGVYPVGGLTRGLDGLFYGTTYGGGTYSHGTFFSLSPSGSLTMLHSFDGTNDGAGPAGQLTQGPDGNFYGTTYYWGPTYGGTVFKTTPTGSFSVVASFSPYSGGYFPVAGVFLMQNGDIYGTTSEGGKHYSGTIFSIPHGGVMTNLHSFNAQSDGQYPLGKLIEGFDGNLYGTTASGGAFNSGSAFQITTNGQFRNLVAFNNLAGISPVSQLLQTPDGYFYGTTVSGGTNNQGTVFELNFHVPVSNAPQIFLPPQNASVSTGQTVSFSVVASGALPLTYQWQSNGVNLVDGPKIQGSQNSTLSILGVSPGDSATYRVIISNAFGSVTNVGNVLSIGSTNPALNISLTNNQVMLFWSANAGNFGLQMATNLVPQTTWSAVTNNSTTNGNQIMVTLPLMTTNRFFRLQSH